MLIWLFVGWFSLLGALIGHDIATTKTLSGPWNWTICWSGNRNCEVKPILEGCHWRVQENWWDFSNGLGRVKVYPEVLCMEHPVAVQETP